MTNWQINGSESVNEYLQKPEVNIGDTIEVITNNQQGYKKYKVILTDGNKDLTTLADWSMDIYEEYDEDDEQDGGKKRRKKTHKTKKSKRSRKARKNRNTKKRRRY
jgi:hypothetical protein